MYNWLDKAPEEIEHDLKWNEFYKILSYLLFSLLIVSAFIMLVLGDENKRLEGKLEAQDKVFIEVLKQQQEAMDTIDLYKKIIESDGQNN